MGPFNKFAVLDKPWYLHTLNNVNIDAQFYSWGPWRGPCAYLSSVLPHCARNRMTQATQCNHSVHRLPDTLSTENEERITLYGLRVDIQHCCPLSFTQLSLPISPCIQQARMMFYQENHWHFWFEQLEQNLWGTNGNGNQLGRRMSSMSGKICPVTVPHSKRWKLDWKSLVSRHVMLVTIGVWCPILLEVRFHSVLNSLSVRMLKFCNYFYNNSTSYSQYSC